MNILARRSAPLSKSPLGIEVSNSEAPPQAGFRPTAPKGHPSGSAATAPKISPSDLALELRSLQASQQAKRCGAWIGGKARLSTFAEGGMSFVGFTASCSSPRCPRCRVSLMDRRKAEIQACIDWWGAKSPLHRVSMVTLTAPHSVEQSLGRLLGSTKQRTGLSGAIALLKQRSVWKKSVREYVSGQEVTHGRNGWHPHYHVLVFHVGDLDHEAWFRSWAAACTDAGLGRPSRAHGLTVQPAESAAGYMAKWGVAAETTGGHLKMGRTGSRSMPEVERAAAAGDKASRQLLKKYFRTMSRRRVHTFSRGLSVVRLRHWLGMKPQQAHFLLDTASSFRLHEDKPLKSALLAVLEDYRMPVLQVFSDLGLTARVFDQADGPGAQFSYEVQRRAKALLGRLPKHNDVDKQCRDLIIDKQTYCLSILSEFEKEEIPDAEWRNFL